MDDSKGSECRIRVCGFYSFIPEEIEEKKVSIVSYQIYIELEDGNNTGIKKIPKHSEGVQIKRK